MLRASDRDSFGYASIYKVIIIAFFCFQGHYAAFGFAFVGINQPAHALLPVDAVVPLGMTPADSQNNVNRSTVTVEELSKEPPLMRAMEIVGVVVGQLLAPLASSLVTDGFPDNWEEFWSHSSGKLTNAERVTQAVEKLGPTYVKFCQAFASRPDVIPKSLADALSTLQDDMVPFNTSVAKEIIRADLNTTLDSAALDALLDSLSEEPVAAASVGQVYKGMVPEYGNVALKVQRPGIRTVVERDAGLLRAVATFVEAIPAPSNKSGRLVATELVNAVDEFMSRIFEELDYRNEASNAATFAKLYSYRDGTCKNVKVVVPEIYPELCTDHVLAMEWLDGTKLTAVANNSSATAENLRLIETGIDCTLSQLLDTGVLHADPHGGNLLKVSLPEGPKLGYLDFGLLSTVPSQVRDALVCSVAQLVFARDVEAVAKLFGELRLLPQEVLLDPVERAALTDALNKTMNEALIYPDSPEANQTQIPKLKFDKLLDALTRLVPRFRFQLPPYFINNARALSTLEGIARSLNPEFNVLQVMYPYALERLLTNPTKSPVVHDTLQSLIRSPTTNRVDRSRISKLLDDSALLTGYRRSRVLADILRTGGGRRLALSIIWEEAKYRLPFYTKRKDKEHRTPATRMHRFLQL